MWIIKNRKIFYSISALAVGASLFAVFFFGLNLGIDFKGGSIVEVSYPDGRPEVSLIKEVVGEGYLVQPAGDDGVILRSGVLEEEVRLELLDKLSFDGANPIVETRSSTIGPTLGKELSRKGLIAIVLVSLLIILFIAFVFRKVSKPVSAWKYGLIAVLALIHDIIIPTGVFAWWGAFSGLEIDALFLTAMLTILGLSVNDTIVVFDRIRENLLKYPKVDFAENIGKSLSQTIVRSINTSVTVIVVLVALYFVGPVATQNFALALIIGMVVGTYSSIFLASPLLVTLSRFSSKKAQN